MGGLPLQQDHGTVGARCIPMTWQAAYYRTNCRRDFDYTETNQRPGCKGHSEESATGLWWHISLCDTDRPPHYNPILDLRGALPTAIGGNFASITDPVQVGDCCGLSTGSMEPANICQVPGARPLSGSWPMRCAGHRPGKCLDFKAPHEVFMEQLHSRHNTGALQT